jgi:hypothetical protein
VEVPSVAQALLALPPSRFTAERNALAKALAAKGDPAAGAVRRLPRPAGLAWLLNRLVRERPQDVEALVAAGERLRAAQRGALSGAGAGALRDAMDDLRARARTLRAEAERILAAEGRPGAPPALARLELLLRVLAPIPGPARDALLRGVLVREPELAPGDLGGFGVSQPGKRIRVSGGAPHAAARTAAAQARDARRARGEEREARARAKRQLHERERAVSAALRAAKAARALADREEREAARATERAQQARARAAAARAEAARLAERARALDPRSSPP